MTFPACPVYCAALLTRYAVTVEAAKAKADEAIEAIATAALEATTTEEANVWGKALNALIGPKDAVEQVIAYLPHMPRSEAEAVHLYRMAWADVEIRDRLGRVMKPAAT